MNGIRITHPLICSGYFAHIHETSLGHLCGYVAVPMSHPWHGLDYTDQVAVPQSILDREIDTDSVFAMALFCAGEQTREATAIELAIDVHGGLTWAQQDRMGWTFGFDCAHSCDVLTPYEETAYSVYRDLAYVTKEVERLACQLREFHI